MTDVTNEMRAARIGLQELTVSDPAVRANMLRHLAAITILVTGRRGTELSADEPQFEAGFQLTPGEQQLCMALTARTGLDQVYVAFDVDDAMDMPLGLGVTRIDGDRVVMHLRCRLWSPVGAGRALIVPTGDGARGQFSFRKGAALRFVDAPPPGDLDAGYRRAAQRQASIRASLVRRGITKGAITRFQNSGSDLLAEVELISA